MKRVLHVVIGLMVSVFAFSAAGPALAAPASGAVVTKVVFAFNEQVDVGFGLLTINQLATTTTVATPSGITNVTLKVDTFVSLTEYATGLTESIQITRTEMSQSVDGVVRLMNDRDSQTSLNFDGTVLTTTTHFMVVDGRVVIDSVKVH
jgi:hypothetical protein